MCDTVRVRLTMIIACLLFSGSALMAQQPVHSDSRTEIDPHGDPHITAPHEFAMAGAIGRPRESFLGWVIRCMGIVGLLIPIAALFSFALTLYVVTRGQGPFAFAAIILLVPTPFLLGLLGTLQGLILSLQVIAVSTTSPKPSELSDGIATALLNPLLGLIFMTPSYLVAIVGSVIRASAKPRSNSLIQP